MKKFLISSILVASALVAHEHGDMHAFDPKAGKHLVIAMEQLGEKGNMNVGEVVAVETNYGVAFKGTCRRCARLSRASKRRLWRDREGSWDESGRPLGSERH